MCVFFLADEHSPRYAGPCETLLSQVTTDGPRVAEKGKVDNIPGVVFVAGRKYFKGISEKKKN